MPPIPADHSAVLADAWNLIYAVGLMATLAVIVFSAAFRARQSRLPIEMFEMISPPCLVPLR